MLAAFEALAVGASFVAVEGRDPERLRADLDLDHPRGYRFEVLDAAPGTARGADGTGRGTAGGQITTELDTVDVRTGDLVWMPRLSQRRFAAGPDGLTYLTVHQRRPPRLFDLSAGASAGRPAQPRAGR